MHKQELKLFLEKCVSGTSTEKEHQQFMEWLETAAISDVEAVLEEYPIHIPEGYSPAGKVDLNLVSKIEYALNQYESAKDAGRIHDKKSSQRLFLRMAIAASFVIFISGIAAYFTLNHTRKDTLAKAAPKQLNDEITPGENKAILTLSDGSTIILDDAKNGQVAEQGGTRIAKLANGQLVYNASHSKPTDVVSNILTTPRGGQFTLTLPDGSKVWLNSISSIKYPTAFIDSERKVEISGEAYFEIAHNAEKPFMVSVNGMVVKVLGTHFNINAYHDETSVKATLLEGSINLTKGTATTTLSPGQQARLSNGEDIEVINNVDVGQVVAWKNGYFSFNRAGLQAVMRQIARWYDVDIAYEGKIPEREFGGKIDRNANISEVLKILEESKVHFRIDGKSIIVSR